MKKLMLSAAMLAMVLVAAAPALAQDVTSGDIFQECVIEFADQNVSADVAQANDQNQSNLQNSENNTAAADSEAAASLDQNQDGIVTTQELNAAAVVDQAAADLNGDGVVNEADVVIANEQLGVGQEGSADATSGDAFAAAGNQYSNQDQDAANVTNITQNVTQEQVAFCEQIAKSVAKGEITKDEALTIIKKEVELVAAAEDQYVTPEAAEAAAAEAAPAEAEAAAAGMLPDTGGASLLALGAGALLVGGGLLARRMFR